MLILSHNKNDTGGSGYVDKRVRTRRPKSAQLQAQECALVGPRVRSRRPESAQSQARKCAVAKKAPQRSHDMVGPKSVYRSLLLVPDKLIIF